MCVPLFAIVEHDLHGHATGTYQRFLAWPLELLTVFYRRTSRDGASVPVQSRAPDARSSADARDRLLCIGRHKFGSRVVSCRCPGQIRP